MAGTIQSPVKGQPMRASWGAAVAAAVNSTLPMGAAGLLARQGVAGTGFAPLPSNIRDRRITAPGNPLFAIGTMDNPDAGEPVDGGSPGETEPEKCKGIVNCYYMKGGVLFKENDFKWDEENWKNGILAFKLPSTLSAQEYYPDDDEAPKPTIELYADIAAVSSAQLNDEFYIQPLYILGDDGNVKLDLRSVIGIQVFEDLRIR